MSSERAWVILIPYFKKPTEIWEDNASCIMMSGNLTNRDRSRHVDVKVHYLRDLVRDGHVKLVKCAGTQNVSDALTKSLERPAFEKQREDMWGTRVPFSAFFSTVEPLSWPIALSCQSSFLLLTSLGKLSVQVAKVSLSTPTRGE